MSAPVQANSPRLKQLLDLYQDFCHQAPLTSEEEGALLSLENDSELESRLSDPSDAISRAVEKLWYANRYAEGSVTWKPPALFQAPAIPREEIPMVEEGDSLVKVYEDGFSVLGKLHLTDFGGIEIEYQPGVLEPNIGTRLTPEELTAALRANGLEIRRGSEKVLSAREYAEEIEQELAQFAEFAKSAALYSSPDGQAVFRLREHLERLLNDQSNFFEQYRDDWFERFAEGANAVLGVYVGVQPFSHGEAWHKVAAYREEIAVTQRLIAEFQAGVFPDLAKISDLPPAVRAILAEYFELDAVQRLRAEGRYEEAFLLAMGIQFTYRNLNEEGEGSIDRNIEGELSPIGRLNNLIENGEIQWGRPILFASDLNSRELRRAIQIYRINHEKSLLPNGQYELALTDAELDREMAYLQKLESLHPKECAAAKQAVRQIEELESIIGMEKAKAFAKIFAEGLFDVMTDPATLIMVASGIGAGAVGRAVVTQLLKKGVPRLVASAIGLTVEGIVWYNLNNAGNIFIHPEAVLEEYGSLDRIVSGNLRSIATLGWLKGVGKVWGRLAETILFRLKNTQPALFTALNASGSFASEAFAFTAQSLFELSLDPNVEITSELVAQELASSVQMVIAFKAFHVVEQGLLDGSHRNLPLTKKALDQLEEAIAEQQKRFESSGSRADAARLQLLQQRHAQVYLYYLEDMEVSLRQARAARDLSEEDYQQRRTELGALGEKVRKMSPEEYRGWLADQWAFQEGQKTLQGGRVRWREGEEAVQEARKVFQQMQGRDDFERYLRARIEGSALYLEYLNALQAQLECQLRLGLGDPAEVQTSLEEITSAQGLAQELYRQLKEDFGKISAMTPEDFELLKARLEAQGELLLRAEEQTGAGQERGTSGGSSSANNLRSLADPPPLEGAAARAMAEPTTPLQHRGLFATNSDDVEVSGGPPSLRQKIEALKQNVRNQPFDPASVEESGDLQKIPLTVGIAKLALEERAAELGVPIDQLTVIVMGFGYNPVEVRIWLQLGVGKVLAVEPDSEARATLDLIMRTEGADRSRLEIKAALAKEEKGDLVTWVYPMVRGGGGPPAEVMTAPLKEGAYLIVETDLREWFIDPLNYEVLYQDDGVNRRNSYFPSIMRRSANSFAILRRPGTEDPAARQILADALVQTVAEKGTADGVTVSEEDKAELREEAGRLSAQGLPNGTILERLGFFLRLGPLFEPALCAVMQNFPPSSQATFKNEIKDGIRRSGKPLDALSPEERRHVVLFALGQLVNFTVMKLSTPVGMILDGDGIPLQKSLQRLQEARLLLNRLVDFFDRRHENAVTDKFGTVQITDKDMKVLNLGGDAREKLESYRKQAEAIVEAGRSLQKLAETLRQTGTPENEVTDAVQRGWNDLRAELTGNEGKSGGIFKTEVQMHEVQQFFARYGNHPSLQMAFNLFCEINEHLSDDAQQTAFVEELLEMGARFDDEGNLIPDSLDDVKREAQDFYEAEQNAKQLDEVPVDHFTRALGTAVVNILPTERKGDPSAATEMAQKLLGGTYGSIDEQIHAVRAARDMIRVVELVSEAVVDVNAAQEVAVETVKADWAAEVASVATAPVAASAEPAQAAPVPEKLENPRNPTLAAKWVPLITVGVEGGNPTRNIFDVAKARTQTMQYDLARAGSPGEERFNAACGRVGRWLEENQGMDEKSLGFYNFIDNATNGDFLELVEALNVIKEQNPVFFLQMMGIDPHEGNDFFHDNPYWGNFLQQAMANTRAEARSRGLHAVEEAIDQLLTIGEAYLPESVMMARAVRLLEQVPPEQRATFATAMAVLMSPQQLAEALLRVSVRDELRAARPDLKVVDNLLSLLGEKGVEKPLETLLTIAYAPVAVLERLDVRAKLAEIFGEEAVADLALLKGRCRNKDLDLRIRVLERMPLVVVDKKGRVQGNHQWEHWVLMMRPIGSEVKRAKGMTPRRGICDDFYDVVTTSWYELIKKLVEEERKREGRGKPVLEIDKPFVLALNLAAYPHSPSAVMLLRHLDPSIDVDHIDFSEVIKALLVMPNPPAILAKHLPELLRRIPEGAQRDAAFRMVVKHAEATGKLADYLPALVSDEVDDLLSEAEQKYVNEKIIPKFFDVSLLGEAGVNKPRETLKAVADAPVAILEKPEVHAKLVEVFGEEAVADLALLKEKCKKQDLDLKSRVLERMPLVVVGKNGRIQYNRALQREVKEHEVQNRGSAHAVVVDVMPNRAIGATVFVQAARMDDFISLKLVVEEKRREGPGKPVLEIDKPFVLALDLAAYPHTPSAVMLLRHLDPSIDVDHIDFSEVIKALLVMPDPPALLAKHLPELLRRIPEGEQRDAAFEMVVKDASVTYLSRYSKALIAKEVYTLLSESEQKKVSEKLVPRCIREWALLNTGTSTLGGKRERDPGQKNSIEFVAWFVEHTSGPMIRQLVNSEFYKYLLREKGGEAVKPLLLTQDGAEVFLGDFKPVLSSVTISRESRLELLDAIERQYPALAEEVQLRRFDERRD